MSYPRLIFYPTLSHLLCNHGQCIFSPALPSWADRLLLSSSLRRHQSVHQSNHRSREMCGRARCTLKPEQVARACGIDDASSPTLQMDRFALSTLCFSPLLYSNLLTSLSEHIPLTPIVQSFLSTAQGLGPLRNRRWIVDSRNNEIHSNRENRSDSICSIFFFFNSTYAKFKKSILLFNHFGCVCFIQIYA